MQREIGVEREGERERVGDYLWILGGSGGKRRKANIAGNSWKKAAKLGKEKENRWKTRTTSQGQSISSLRYGVLHKWNGRTDSAVKEAITRARLWEVVDKSNIPTWDNSQRLLCQEKVRMSSIAIWFNRMASVFRKRIVLKDPPHLKEK